MAQNDQQPVIPVNNDGNDDNDNNGVPIHHAQAVQGADGGINLKVEQTKLPEFWGQREKDSITPNAFIQRVDNMMAANNWSGHIAFRNFALVLCGSANIWLKSQEFWRTLLATDELGPSFGHFLKLNSPSSLMTNAFWMGLLTWLCSKLRMFMIILAASTWSIKSSWRPTNRTRFCPLNQPCKTRPTCY
jgi:hypothetical protein